VCVLQVADRLLFVADQPDDKPLPAPPRSRCRGNGGSGNGSDGDDDASGWSDDFAAGGGLYGAAAMARRAAALEADAGVRRADALEASWVVRLASRAPVAEGPRAQLRRFAEALRWFDADGSGQLNGPELRAVLVRMLPGAPAGDIDTVLGRYLVGSDGTTGLAPIGASARRMVAVLAGAGPRGVAAWEAASAPPPPPPDTSVGGQRRDAAAAAAVAGGRGSGPQVVGSAVKGASELERERLDALEQRLVAVLRSRMAEDTPQDLRRLLMRVWV